MSRFPLIRDSPFDLSPTAFRRSNYMVSSSPLSTQHKRRARQAQSPSPKGSPSPPEHRISHAQSRTGPPGVTMADQHPSRSVQHLTNRLQRIEGQVRGIQRMVADGREAEEVLIQISAVLAATRRLAGIVAREAIEDALDADSAGLSDRIGGIIEAFSRLD
ncbi:MAG TPA: hypothetical protein DGT21_08190 [Armatimonadetes bacterium]|nr:hypothetical protein [Armatimonadota bacterium]